MCTEIVPVSDAVIKSPALEKRFLLRTMDAETWIDRHGSGTLRKNKRLGFAWRDQYLHERVAFEFDLEGHIISWPHYRILWNTSARALPDGFEKIRKTWHVTESKK